MIDKPKRPPTDPGDKARPLSGWRNERDPLAREIRSGKPQSGLDRARAAVAVLCLVAAVPAGWFGLSGWLALPIGIIAFFGSMKALPEKTGLIAAAGIIAYVLAAFLLMWMAGWVHARID
jgi:hypothetical protein